MQGGLSAGDHYSLQSTPAQAKEAKDFLLR